MPGYLNMPAIWSTELAKKIAGEITTDVIFDADGTNPIHLNGRIWVNSIGTISIKNELDVNWSMRPTLSDLRIDIIDQDEFFNIKNSSSPFFLAFGVLSEAAVSGQNFVKLTDATMAGFSAGNIITISDGTNSQTFMVKLGVTVGTDRILYFYDNLSYSFATAMTYVFSNYFEEKKLAIDLRLAGSLQPFRLFTGSVLSLPEFNNKRAAFTVTDLRKSLMDSPVIGADAASGTKLMAIDTAGALVSSIHWITGSGTLDRSKVTVHSACRTGKWTVDFDSDTSYVISGPGKTEAKSTLVDNVTSVANAGKVTGVFTDPFGVVIKDNRAYICDRGNDTFYIYNITDVDAPALLGSYTEASDMNGCRACVISGNYAYVISEYAGTLATLDISDPASISQLNLILGLGAVNSIVKNDSCLYVSSYDGDSVIAFDIVTDAEKPIERSTITGVGSPNYLGGAFGLKIVGNRLYVSSYDDGGISVWSLIDPDSPELLGAYEVGGNLSGIDVVDYYVYICRENVDKLEIYDFTDAANPITLGNISGSGSPNYLDNIIAVKVIGNYAFCLGATNNSLVCIDCTDKATPVLFQAIQGTGSPYYLEDCQGIDVAGEKIAVTAITDSALSLFEIQFDTSNDLITDQITIPISAWTGDIVSGDSVEFWTGISFNNINVIQALYNIYTKKLSNQFLDCSSYFGNKQIGTLYKGHAVGATTLLVRNSVPIIIPDADVLTITEGATTEDITVQALGGNAEATSFPPYISLTVSALANAYTSAATVTWKQRGSLDTNYSFDREHAYCASISASLKFTVAKEMSYQQLILLILAHSNSFNFQSNYGVECVTTLRSESTVGVPVLAYNTNLKKLTVQTLELTNKFIADYQFDYLEDDYDGSVSYPSDDSQNQSYLKHGIIKQAETVKLPGFLTSALASANLGYKYNFYQNGVILYKADVTLQGLNLPIGSIVQVQSLYPNITAYAKIIGYDVSVNPYNIQLTLLDISHLL